MGSGPVTVKMALQGCRLLFAVTLIASAVMGGQRFEERPQNTTESQGRTAELKCAIRDRAGRVQWVKDGFALGYDRDLPGYPRYSVIGSNSRQFNLQLANVTLSDDAQYQCQVTPSGPSNPRLTASAHLTILVPCDAPVIRDPQSASTVQVYLNGSTVQVPYTRTSLQLVCEARNGRPAAEIEWYRNNQRVTRNVQYETEPIVGDKRINAKSTLSLTLQGNTENGAVFRCQAKNSAMRGQALATSVTISILFPPGNPVITGYRTGQAVRANSTVQLTCTSVGGNPLGSVVWYRGEQRVDSSYSSGDNRAVNQYNFTARPLDNAVTFRCEVTNFMTDTALVSSVTLTVHFPPERVTMSGGSGNHEAGDTVRLTCVTTPSNPRATIRWTGNGRRIPSSAISNSHRDSSNGGEITTSRARVTLPNQEHDILYTCHASNNVDREVTDSVNLRILYPPNAPTISRNPDSSSIRASQLQRMTCTSVGGNPLATLKWYKNGRLLSNAVRRTVGGIAESEIGIVAHADDNGATYKCTAKNNALSSALETTVTLTVLFPPTSVSITTSTNEPQAGQGMNLTCVSSSSNPAAEIVWFKNGHRLQGVSQGVVNAQHGGKNATNVLHLVPTSSDHEAAYACQATNPQLNLSVTDAVTLSVLFPPEFDSPVPTVINMTARDSQRFNVSANANPRVSSYTLRRDGRRTTRFRVNSQGQLRISNINKNDGGNFTVRAENSQGSATYNFTIIVKYSASITSVTRRLFEDEGRNATLECVAEAYPLTPNMITWTRPGFNMNGRTRQHMEGSRSYLTVYELVRADSGTFTCNADNGIGSPSTRTAKLIIKYAPIIDKSPEHAKVAGEKGATATLTCRAEGAPEISFTWYKGNRTVSGRRSKYRISTRDTDTVNFRSTLRVSNVAREDYGSYNCTATNSKGTDSFLISLHGKSKPDPPYDLVVVNSTEDSITVGWKPGFDGGLPQSYRVRYKPTLARGYIYVDVYTPVVPVFIMANLKRDAVYEVTALAFNSLGESDYQSRVLIANTSTIGTSPDITELQEPYELPFIVIVLLCIFGVFILALNIGLILFFIRRRKRRLESAAASDSTSHTNTLKLYTPNKVDGGFYPVAVSDDTTSYTTYDKGDQDFSDEESDSQDYESEYAAHPYTATDREPPPMAPYVPHTRGYPTRRSSGPAYEPYHVGHSRHKAERQDNTDELYHSQTFPRGNIRPELTERYQSREVWVPQPPQRRQSLARAGNLPPVPVRHYGPHNLHPRYAPLPGAASTNRNYSRSSAHPEPSHHPHLASRSEMRGHHM